MRTLSLEGPRGPVNLGGDAPPFFILGPCVIESRSLVREVAAELASIRDRLGVPILFKSSYDKANRTSAKSFRGIGMDEGLSILSEVRAEWGFPVVSDVHDADQVSLASEVLDVLQIPAFLCRQTDLLVAAGESGKTVHVKKGQFLAPEDMRHVVDKIAATGNHRILVCERGVSFGYHTLVVDFRSLPVLASFGYPVVFDATHSVQSPGGAGGRSGGDRRFVWPLARAAATVGCQGIFMEVHPDPDHAPSDGPNMVPLGKLENLLKSLLACFSLRRSLPDDPALTEERTGEIPS
ncbi:MAG: 3-deoxy-8-phosphooctulonate synthase [Nitrospirae bacterium]|nr:3-deoxy-8-phosphooctulonate synthase [Nitrospirota bacterium]